MICAAINILTGFKALTGENPGNKTWPRLFGDSGMFAIFLWGVAYLSVCRSYPHAPWTVLLFGVEKLFYVIAWAALLKAKKGDNTTWDDVSGDAKPVNFFAEHCSQILGCGTQGRLIPADCS